MSKLIASIRQALANRRAYHRAIDQIARLDSRDLADMNADRDTLMAYAYREVYGTRR